MGKGSIITGVGSIRTIAPLNDEASLWAWLMANDRDMPPGTREGLTHKYSTFTYRLVSIAPFKKLRS
jgi:hypothetical protein